MPTGIKEQSTPLETPHGPTFWRHAWISTTLCRRHNDRHRWFPRPPHGKTRGRIGTSGKGKHKDQTSQGKHRSRHGRFPGGHMETGKIEYTRSKDSIIPRYTSPGHTKKSQISPLCTVILPTIRTKICKPDTGSNGPNNAPPETVPPDRIPKEAIPRADRHHMHKHDTIPTGSQEAVLCTNRRFTILWSRKSIPKGRGGQRTTSGMHFTHLHKNGTKLQHNKEGSVGTALHTAFHGLLPPICIKNRDSGGCPINPIPTNVQRQRRHSPTFLIRAVQIQCRNSTRPRRGQRSSGRP